MKVLVLGFDALDYEIFENYVPSGYKTCKPLSEFPMTVPGWTEIYTGTKWDGLPWRYSDWENFFLQDGFNNVKHKTFWDILNANGKIVELFNLPVTYPPKPANRFLVSGFPILDMSKRDFTYPEGLVDLLPNNYLNRMDIVNYSPKLDTCGWIEELQSMTDERFLQIMKDDSYFIANEYLKLHREVDLAFVAWTFTDRISHLKPYLLEKSYELTVDLIKMFESTLNPDNILIVADHGCQWDKTSKEAEHTHYPACAIRGDLEPVTNLKEIANSILKIWNLRMEK
jgi:hypothetical protein